MSSVFELDVGPWLVALGVALLALAPYPAVAQPTAALHVSVSDAEARPVADAVVVAVPLDGSVIAGAHPRSESLEQIDKEFIPKVKAVYVGSTVSFPNRDSVRHHVYSFSPAKRFEVPLYAGVPAQPVLFDKVGVVVLGCNIHDWMIGYVYVSESPYFAKTGPDGTAVIGNVRAGTFIVRVWHPRLAGSESETRREISVSGGHTIDLQWTIGLKAEARVRRAPGVEHAGHY